MGGDTGVARRAWNGRLLDVSRASVEGDRVGAVEDGYLEANARDSEDRQRQGGRHTPDRAPRRDAFQ
ncbi:hypothetical protein D3C83_92050 [compost metagenome]